ncbi:hypothetical protein KAR91_74295 [Candidatus Pacearchaeota archaeon]|nr:hypothetical protein [Candidatus Pacearchaeota archaeon]
MADTGIFATTAEILRKAGANASAVSVTEAYTNDFIAQAESEINALTRVNWSDEYAGLNADVKAVLKEAASNLAAMYIISYDMSGFTSRLEATTMLDLLRDSYLRALGVLREIQVQTFVKNA